MVKIKQEHNNNYDNNNNNTHFQENYRTFVIWGFRHDVDEICALLGYYAACSGNA